VQTTLYLVRHGETDWNVEKRIQGRIDRPLNETGKEQARMAGQKLSPLRAAAIYTSPLLRAQHTAELIAAFQACPLLLEENLREAAYGACEGLTQKEFHERHKDLLQKRGVLSFEEWLGFKVPDDAESPAEIIERVLPVLLRIAGAHVGENVFVVTHGFVMCTLIAFFKKERVGISVENGQILILKGNNLSLELHHDAVD
jgi:broad specificity phosphatase PhoE